MSRLLYFPDSLFPRGAESSLRQFRAAEGSLALTPRMVRFAIVESWLKCATSPTETP